MSSKMSHRTERLNRNSIELSPEDEAALYHDNYEARLGGDNNKNSDMGLEEDKANKRQSLCKRQSFCLEEVMKELDPSINNESSDLSSSGMMTGASSSSGSSFGFIKASFLDEASRLSNHLCERRFSHVEAMTEVVDVETDSQTADSSTEATGTTAEAEVNSSYSTNNKEDSEEKSISVEEGTTKKNSDKNEDISYSLIVYSTSGDIALMRESSSSLNDTPSSKDNCFECADTSCAPPENGDVAAWGTLENDHRIEFSFAVSPPGGEDAAYSAVKRQSLTLDEALALKDMLEDDGGSRESMSSCSTMSSALSSTGSFGFIKAAFFDEISHCSNHRCAKRGADRDDDSFDDMDMEDDDDDDEYKNEMGDGSHFIQEDEYDEVGNTSATRDLRESSLVVDETRRLDDRLHSIKISPEDVPKDIVVMDDPKTCQVTSESKVDDVETKSNEEHLARSNANDEFEKFQHAPTEVRRVSSDYSEEKKKKVSFSTVEVRQYERIIGDHPSCSSGPPIGIGWGHDSERTRRLSVDEHHYSKRWNKNVRLSKQQRTSLLLELGVPGKDIVRTVRKMEKDKRKRRQTLHNLHMGKVEEMAESAKRKIKTSLVGKSKKDCPYEEWTPKVKKSAMRTPPSQRSLSGIVVRIV